MHVRIDPEFQAFIPPLAEDEFAQLEMSVRAEGCRDPLVLWNNIIVDGHHRYHICTKHQLPFKTVEMDFADREAAMDWMDSNQLGRRNLTPDQRSILRGRRYNRMKKTKSEAGAIGGASNGKIYRCSSNTAEGIAKQHGVTEKTIRNDGKKAEAIEQLKRTDKESAQAVLNGTKRFNEVRREIKWAEVKEAAAFPTDKYRILYADPPWKYGDNLTESYGAAKWHYPSMTIDELCALPVEALAQDDAVLFLWVTAPLLKDAFPIIEAWGFTYKTHFVWDKVKHNMGHYCSVRHEDLLLGTRGSCQPDIPKLMDSVQSIERSKKHSEKPEEFRTIIDTLYPYGKRLELFARQQPHQGWEAWGNEAM
jgi:N6-adenosine-specific RNA methylase IME4